MDPKNPQPGMEGEGNKTADREYRKGVDEHVKKGDVEREAKQAEHDIEENPDEYARAAEEGKRHSAGELERDLRKPEAVTQPKGENPKY